MIAGQTAGPNWLKNRFFSSNFFDFQSVLKITRATQGTYFYKLFQNGTFRIGLIKSDIVKLG